jgi:hypothetical protein
VEVEADQTVVLQRLAATLLLQQLRVRAAQVTAGLVAVLLEPQQLMLGMDQTAGEAEEVKTPPAGQTAVMVQCKPFGLTQGQAHNMALRAAVEAMRR